MSSPTFVARPENATPWNKKSKKSLVPLVLASIFPVTISFSISLALNLPGAITLIVIFLPLQMFASGVAARISFGKNRIADSLLATWITFAVALVATLLGSLIFSVIKNGIGTLTPQFLTQNNVYISSTTSLEYGGAAHAVLGSLLVVGLATVFTLPIGVAVAVFLTETNSRLTGLVRFITQSMSGLPSIVSGLFVFAAFVLSGIAERAGWLGSFALVFLMLPTVSRMAEEVLKLIPAEIRNAALALGAPRRKAFFQVILPAARTGIVTAALLGLARIVGETAPLIVTTVPGNQTNFNVFSGDISTLPTYIYKFISDISQSSQHRAWGAALELLILVGILFVLARVLGKQKVK